MSSTATNNLQGALQSFMHSQQLLMEQLAQQSSSVGSPLLSSAASVSSFTAETTPGFPLSPATIPASLQDEVPAPPSPTPSPLPMDPVSDASRNSRFFIVNDLVTFMVELELFQIPRSMLRTDSPKALDILARQKERLDGVIVLGDLTALDFERFLTVLDSKIFEVAPLNTKDEWISVLAAAHVFGHTHVHEYAVSHLAGLTTAVDKVVLARKYDVPSWVKDAYFAVCTAEKLPSDEDLDRLGFEDLKKIVRVRDELHVSDHGGIQRPGFKLAVVEKMFGLQQSVEVDEIVASPQVAPDDWFGSSKKKEKKGVKTPFFD